MENIGRIIKGIRESKGIKTKYVYDGILSRSMYYKFENGLSDISLNHFLGIANRLNINLSELEALTDYHDGYKENLGRLRLLHYDGDYQLLEEFSQELLERYAASGYIYYQHLGILSQLLLSYIRGEAFNQSQVQTIKDYLFNAEDWMYYELSLFTNSLFIYDLEDIDNLFKRVSASLNSVFPHNSDVFLLVSNILCLCFQKDDLNRIRKYIKILKNLPMKNSVMLTHFLRKFYTSLYNFVATSDVRYEEEIQSALLFLEKIELEHMAVSHRRLYEKVKKNLVEKDGDNELD